MHKSCPFIQEIATIMDWGATDSLQRQAQNVENLWSIYIRNIQKEILVDFTYIPT